MDLMIPLNTRSEKPLYEQIYQYIKDEIRNGSMKPERKLPSTRELAKSLKVSRSTTQLAYEQLISEGYVEAVPRKGYFAAGLDGLLPPVGGENPGKEPEKAKKQAEPRPKKKEETRFNAVDSPLVDFSPRGIDLESFPFSTWGKLSRAVLREENGLLLKGEPQGDLALREAVRDYLHAARGVNCDVSQLVVGAGNEYLLMLLSQLLGKEAVIAMENPTYRQAYRVFSALGHPVLPVGMDKSGFRVEELSGKTVRAAYVMPSHQFPMGVVMPVRRRQELLAWAAAKPGRFLIEDDYDSEFRYKGKPIPALQGMDRNGSVIYMGTFSKAIAPAIRVGYLVLPKPLLEKYRETAGFYSSTVSRVDQQLLSRFISGGYFERHLNRMREIYKGKHDVLLAALKPLEAEFSLAGEYGGLHVLLKNRRGRTEKELLEAARAAGVRVYGLSGFFMEPGGETHTVVLGYASLKEEEIKEGAGLLLKAFLPERM